MTFSGFLKDETAKWIVSILNTHTGISAKYELTNIRFLNDGFWGKDENEKIMFLIPSKYDRVLFYEK